MYIYISLVIEFAPRPASETISFKHYVFPAAELIHAPKGEFYGEDYPIEDSTNEASKAQEE
jgi:hypothetical protein